MGISQGEEKLANTLLEAQNSSNIQSSQNTIELKKYFGPRLDALTSAIEHASDSSGQLSKVIIGVTIVGVAIAALQLYSKYAGQHDFSKFTDDQLTCVVGVSKGQSEKMLGATVELCLRRYP